VSSAEREAHCQCQRPMFVSHGGWWRCRNCQGWLPFFDRPGAIVFMRERIAAGRAALVRERSV
jgi:hypothetical protein